jgi:heme/copper-type cytochrome/quinol oxidase subunit 3
VDITRTTTGNFARRFFLAAIGVFAASTAITALLAVLFHPREQAGVRLPPAFAATTALLVFVSGSLVRAVHCVRRERQRPFRHSLIAALAAGTLFVGIQGFGLWSLLASRTPGDAQTGALAFAFVFAALHAMHVTIALLFLLFVTLRAQSDRYDHEYYWGVTVTGWFWHALGIVWLVILAVIAIAV